MTEPQSAYPYEYMSMEDINYKMNMFLKTCRQMKRKFPPLYAEQIIGVQPLSAPTGLLYYLRNKYSKPPITNNVNIIEDD